MKCRAMFAAAVIGVASLAQAATLSQKLDFSFSLPNQTGSQTLNFSQFNDLGGTRQLVSVDLTVDGVVSAALLAENTTSLPLNDVTVGLSGSLFGAGPTGLGVNVALVPNTVTLTTLPAEGYAGNPAYTGWLVASASNTGSSTTSLASYVGTGNVAVMISGSEVFGHSAQPGDVTVTSTGGDGSWGNATLTYNWVAVPEPATLGLLAFSSLALLRRSPRKQTAAS